MGLPAGGQSLPPHDSERHKKNAPLPIPYRRSSMRGSSFADLRPPAFVRSLAPDKLGLDCEQMLLYSSRPHKLDANRRMRAFLNVTTARSSHRIAAHMRLTGRMRIAR